ncbi:hypothetical protein JOQ06_011223 [Pogonophryne albipinna]|uniref:Transposase Tc1-like domain-containing protein n=1 Tax=Pogonophryne albipinna TaxID=1090488 RepID=A0AAD6ABI5_9TELE|nr:hypothetical protein JOQ06_011223 [Pogonophryne albipinna]
MITRTVSKDPRNTRGDLVNDLQRAGTKVTKATISNTLRRQGLKSCSARRVPLLKPVHVQARLKFDREHLDDPEEDWENVIWYYLNIDMFGKELDPVRQQLLCHLQRHTATLKGHVMCQVYLHPPLWKPMVEFCRNILNVELVKEYTEQCVLESDVI